MFASETSSRVSDLFLMLMIYPHALQKHGQSIEEAEDGDQKQSKGALPGENLK